MSTHSISIRPATAKDAPDLSHLLKQLGYVASPEECCERIKNISSSDNDLIFVAVVDNGVVGCMSLCFSYYFPTGRALCRITAIVVKEELRGHGIGTALINHARAQALKRNCQGVEITTALAREKTQQYYEHIGFKKTSYRYFYSDAG